MRVLRYSKYSDGGKASDLAEGGKPGEDMPLLRGVVLEGESPAVVEAALSPSDEFLLIASDGVWNAIHHSQKAVDLVREALQADPSAP